MSTNLAIIYLCRQLFITGNVGSIILMKYLTET